MNKPEFDEYFIPLAAVFFSSMVLVDEKSKAYYASLRDFKVSTWKKVSLEATDAERMLKPNELKQKCRYLEPQREETIVEWTPDSIAFTEGALSERRGYWQALADAGKKSKVDNTGGREGFCNMAHCLAALGDNEIEQAKKWERDKGTDTDVLKGVE